jgi:acyl-CoA thioesterase-1
MPCMKWLRSLRPDLPPRSYRSRRHLVHRLIFAAIVTMAWAILSVIAAEAVNGPVRIVALGDSLSAGFGLPAKDAFPAKLEQALKDKGLDVAIEDAGASGDTASGGLARLDWSVPEGTEAVILEFGANDALRGIDPNITRAALDNILQRLKTRGIAVLLCGMRAPRNLGPDYARAFDSIFPELAAKYDTVYYSFFLEGAALDQKFTLNDRLHPNAAGVAVIVAGILPKAEELVARVRAKRNS